MRVKGRKVNIILSRIFLIFWFTTFSSLVFAESWGGYVNHEGPSKKEACFEAKKHAHELCRNHGASFNVDASSFSCKTHKTAMYNNKKLYFVNLVFTCKER